MQISKSVASDNQNENIIIPTFPEDKVPMLRSGRVKYCNFQTLSDFNFILDCEKDL